MTVDEWKNKITNAIRKNLTAQPDRAGSTPLSRLADKLEACTPNSVDGDKAINALVFLIKNPADEFVGNAEKQYWRAMMGLSRSLQTHAIDKIASAFYTKLFGLQKLSDNLRVFALNGAVSAGRKFTPKELKKLSSILQSNPNAWLNAAITGGNFDMAIENINKRLKDDTLNINAFILSLDGWRRNWRDGEDFFNLVKTFENATSSPLAKNKLNNWIKRRADNLCDYTDSQRAKPVDSETVIIPEESINRAAKTSNFYEFSQRGEDDLTAAAY